MFRRHPLAIVIAAAVAGSWTPLAIAQQESAENTIHKESDKPEVIVITASPLARTQISSAQPVSVIAGDELREQHAHTLGETLENEPGISSTHFAGVASSPIIRGLDGPRVKVTQNGLDSGDVSRSSPDHAVTTETSVAEQIEILRGPATLLYGSGAIGGVVNVVDNRIAQEAVGGSRGFYGTRFDTASSLREATLGFTADHKDTVWHFDGFKRRSDDYDVPAFTNDEGETEDTVENSFIDAQGANFGFSYLFDGGYAGVAYGRLEQEYGIPGHHHGHEEEHEDEHGDEHGDEHEGEHADDHMEEAGPYAELWQNRIQFHAGLYQPWTGIEQAEVRYGFTDYQHQEIEDGAPASTFQNEQNELRVTLTHEPLAGWNGAFGYHYFDQDLNAFGEEAYTPPSTTTRHGLFWLVEQQFGDLNWQGGLRYEQVDVDAPTLVDNAYSSLSFTPLSASIGFTYQATPQLQFAANFSHAQRAPSGSELFSDGTHLATQTYELGLVYELHQEGEHEYHVEASDRAPVEEKSNNIDLGMHFETEHLHLQANLFYNQVDDYVFGAFTGVNSEDLMHEDEHDDHGDEHGSEHGDEHADEHDHGEGLPVIAFTQRDVELYGYELSGKYHLNERWEVEAFSDYIRARTRDGAENLPRIPTQRFGTDVHYLGNNWRASLGYTYYAQQDRIAINEEPTASYGLVDAKVSWFPSALAEHNISLYAKAENLTDELGFVHTSFLKEDAPVRGRNFSIGIRGEF